MKYLFSIILFFLIVQNFSSLFGQFTKPKGSFLPPKIIGNVSASQKNILIKTLEENLSKHFIFSKSTFNLETMHPFAIGKFHWDRWLMGKCVLNDL